MAMPVGHALVRSPDVSSVATNSSLRPNSRYTYVETARILSGTAPSAIIELSDC